MYARVRLVCLSLSLCAAISATPQTSNNFRQVNLVSNVPGLALNVDPDLAKPWGIAFSVGQPFRIVSNSNGKFKSYDATGAQQDPRAIVAPPSGGMSSAMPSGVAANPTSLFVPRTSLSTPFIFATQKGTISTEYADGRGDILLTTILTVDNSSQGAEYTGLAVSTPDCCAPFLAVADFHGGFVETLTSDFQPLGIPGAFIDPNLPAGYAPFNISVIGNDVFVDYAVQDAAGHDPVFGPGNGIIDIYDLAGSFVRRFASNGPLNAPWGVVKASANFGEFSNDVLVGNIGDGTINAFDPVMGEFIGQLKDGNGNVIANSNLRGMVFGEANTTADPNTLYITSSPAGATSGVFAAISVNNGGAGPDFSLSASPGAASVSPGQSTMFSLTATPVADFRGAFSFSCTATAGVTCSVGQATVDVMTGAATVTLTATAAASSQSMAVMSFTFPCVLLAGLCFARRGRSLRANGVSMIALAAAAFGIVATIGCGSYSRMMRPAGGTASIVVTATAGSVSHTSALVLTVQ